MQEQWRNNMLMGPGAKNILRPPPRPVWSRRARRSLQTTLIFSPSFIHGPPGLLGPSAAALAEPSIVTPLTPVQVEEPLARSSGDYAQRRVAELMKTTKIVSTV